uniref:hypothetical protein n=1 Tax=Pseudomonas chlororaphis TaxID=587753 RepID=UPI003983B6D2
MLARLYSGRQVMRLDIDVIADVGGAIHCVSHEQPVVCWVVKIGLLQLVELAGSSSPFSP